MSTVTADSEVETETAQPPIMLRLLPVLNLTEDQFFDFCQINQDVRIERNAQREITIMSPTGWDSGVQDSEINRQLANWARQNGTGASFSSSAGFCLPNGAMRSPDASWVSFARLNALDTKYRKKFVPLCPDFVIELRSSTDRLHDLKTKMGEYIANGLKMGLLINPDSKQVYVYQPNQAIQQLDNCETVSCESVLPGFELDLRLIW